MASVTYRIGGKYDGSAMRSARSGVESLSRAFSAARGVVAGFIGAKALGGIKRLLDGSTDSFLRQNSALRKFEAAAARSSVPLERMEALRSRLSHGNFFDDDTLNGALALAANLGLTEESMEAVLDAAHDMAAAGIMPLDTAVKQLSGSLSGSLGTLGRISPELKSLSEEELRNGGAVERLRRQYAGLAAQLSDTFAGRDTKFRNALGDLKSEAGGILQAFRYISEGSFLSPVERLTGILRSNREGIIRFVLALPAMAGAAADGIWDIVTQTFSGPGFASLLSFWANSVMNQAVLIAKAIPDLMRAAFEVILNLVNVTAGNALRQIKNVLLVPLGNALIEGVNTALSKVMDNKAVQWIARNIFHADGFDGSNVIEFRFSKSDLATWEQLQKNVSLAFGDAFYSVSKAGRDFVAKESANIKAFGATYADAAQRMRGAVSDALSGTELPEDLAAALRGAADDAAAAIAGAIEDASPGYPDGASSASGGGRQGGGAEILGAIGEIGEIVSAGLNGGLVGVIVYLAGKILSMAAGLSELVSDFMSAVSVAIGEFLPELTALLEAVIGPLLPLVRQVGQVVGVILRLIQPLFPVIKTIGDIFANVVSFILKGLYNAVVAVHNIFVSKKNRWSYWSDSASSASAAAADTSGAATSRNSVTAARDIYVYVTYSHSYVNGDSRAIALSIRDEIRRAERLGY